MIRNEPATVVEVAPDDTVPLSLLAVELGETVDEVVSRIHRVAVGTEGGVYISHDDIGRRAVSRDVAREVIATKVADDEARQALRQRQQEEVMRRAREAEAQVPQGVRMDGLEGVPAVAAMTAAAGHQERLDAAGERFEEYASGASYYHPIQTEED
jgi:hypothetical protein